MHFTGLIPLLAVGTAYAAPAASPQAAALEARQVPVLPCSHTTGGLHVLALGGANTNNPKDYGYLYSLSKSILNAIPGSTNVSVPYDKVLITNPPPNHLQPGAVANGMKTLKQYVVDYHRSCPQTKMAIIGYSSGGVIAMNDFCYGGDGNGTPQLNPLLAGSYIVAGVLYGEETRVAGESFNKGTCTTGHGTAPRANPSLCNTYAPYLQSYCDNNDPDCCVGGPQPYDVNVHFSYPAKYDAIATQYVKQRLAASGGA